MAGVTVLIASTVAFCDSCEFMQRHIFLYLSILQALASGLKNKI